MSWATDDDVIKADRQRGVTVPINGISTGNLTGATVNSGGIAAVPLFNNLGTTLWSAFKGFPLPPGVTDTTDWRALWLKNASVRVGAYWLANFYKIGDVNLAASGQQLTHHAAGFPLSRTMGYGSEAVRGFPLIVTTTATSTTAPVITNIKYRNGDGNIVTGTQSFTYPATNTVIGSSYLLSLEDADESIQDITEVNIGTPSSAGTAAIYLAEPILPASVFMAGMVTQTDGLRGARLGLPRINPAAPASGTVDWALGMLAVGVASSNTANALLRVVPQQ